jgi:flagellar basal-body rod protein FlgB
MLMGLTSNFTDDVLSKGMDGHLARQTAITGNIANVETPGYHRRDVLFTEELQAAVGQHQQSLAQQTYGAGAKGLALSDELELQATNPMHVGWRAQQGKGNPLGITLEATQDTTHAFRSDKNNVDVEIEMVQLAKNASRFKALTVLQGRRNQMFKQVLQGSGQV